MFEGYLVGYPDPGQKDKPEFSHLGTRLMTLEQANDLKEVMNSTSFGGRTSWQVYSVTATEVAPSSVDR